MLRRRDGSRAGHVADARRISRGSLNAFSTVASARRRAGSAFDLGLGSSASPCHHPRVRAGWKQGWLAALLLMAAGFAASGGCSAVVDPDVGKLGVPPAPTCMPKRVVSCACVGGLTGTQICNAGGSYDPCNCGTAGSGATSSKRGPVTKDR
jgi:hypothetical protein